MEIAETSQKLGFADRGMNMVMAVLRMVGLVSFTISFIALLSDIWGFQKSASFIEFPPGIIITTTKQ